ncbi:zinc finger BED domain-containing protein DAYSLEEPER-like [Rhizophagus clarus]|uniref:Zinc finger BED domain-containing protein DAYSLEEPER-like n=1 Tax=Rhizophagus clarus TaxID=94130 RepID=A0A8H3KVL3_9GLOM|nr:zinc finger BED domain-containing protein DAYSLEEPER-like [Rhizophagus clarus]
MLSVEEDSFKNNKLRKLTIKEGPLSDICDTEYARKDSLTGNAILKGKRYTKQQQKELRQFLVDWIISDSLPIHIIQSKAFQRFIYELDPAFMMPCEETVRKIIYETYNYSFPQLKDMLSV